MSALRAAGMFVGRASTWILVSARVLSRPCASPLGAPPPGTISGRMAAWFGIETKRTVQRGERSFAFMRPGDVVIEVIGPSERPAEPQPGNIAGLCFECTEIDDLAADLKAKGYPVGEPHPALQGGRIVSLNQAGACGVPLAFIDFTGSPGPLKR